MQGRNSCEDCFNSRLFFVLSTGLGGFEFMLSSFLNNANSAMMGGSFIGAYAFYFIELYYTKKKAIKTEKTAESKALLSIRPPNDRRMFHLF